MLTFLPGLKAPAINLVVYIWNILLTGMPLFWTFLSGLRFDLLITRFFFSQSTYFYIYQNARPASLGNPQILLIAALMKT